MNLGGIILAAGSSSRMGQSKQMLEVNGETLLRKTVQTVLTTPIQHIVVVLGANEINHRDSLSGLAIDIIVNHRWSNGMGTSIKAGMEFLSRTGGIDAVVIFVCDQPLLSAEVILGLISEYQTSGKQIVASSYSHSAGVPAIFDKSLFNALLDLPDEHGAKKIIERDISETALVPFAGGEIDLDTMEEYKKFVDGRIHPL